MEDNTNTGRAGVLPLAALSFEGADAADFLQGQITINAATLQPLCWRRAAHCSRQGRVLANGMLGRLPNNAAGARFVFVVAADVAAGVAAHLRKFVLRAKVKIGEPRPLAAEPANGGGNGQTLAEENGEAVFYDGAWRLRPAAAPAAPQEWALAQIQNGVAWVGAAAQDKHIPQFLNLDLQDGIDFDKGCYVGQEIIARLHYLGEVKRRLRVATGAGAPPPAGAALANADGKKIGDILMAAQTENGYAALAVAQLQDLPQEARAQGEPARLALPAGGR